MNINVTIEIRSLVSEAPKTLFQLAMASRRAAFSGITSLISTFSSFSFYIIVGEYFFIFILCYLFRKMILVFI